MVLDIIVIYKQEESTYLPLSPLPKTIKIEP